jgi:hypothetical protein
VAQWRRSPLEWCLAKTRIQGSRPSLGGAQRDLHRRPDDGPEPIDGQVSPRVRIAPRGRRRRHQPGLTRSTPARGLLAWRADRLGRAPRAGQAQLSPEGILKTLRSCSSSKGCPGRASRACSTATPMRVTGAAPGPEPRELLGSIDRKLIAIRCGVASVPRGASSVTLGKPPPAPRSPGVWPPPMLDQVLPCGRCHCTAARCGD